MKFASKATLDRSVFNNVMLIKIWWFQDSFMPPSERCSYECDKTPTGPLNRKKLIDHINKQALETPDIPELKPYVPGVVRGKKVSIDLFLPLFHTTFMKVPW